MPVEMTEAQISQFLAEQPVGHLGLIDDGTPYVVPISYAYQDGKVYCHSAPGRKIRALRSHSSVCFEVDEVTDLSTWTSVIAWGRFEQLLGEDARQALEVLLDKFRPLFASGTGMVHPGAEVGMMRTLNIPRPATEEKLGRPATAAIVYSITLDTLSGRMETPSE